MQVQPYLFFDGRCEEALAFYEKALDARIGMKMRFKEAPEGGGTPPGAEDKIMHAQFQVGDTTLLASDGHCTGKPNFQGFSLTLTPATDAEAKKLFAALSDGGEVRMPLAATFFSSCFGMLSDRFGVAWMIYVPQ